MRTAYFDFAVYDQHDGGDKRTVLSNTKRNIATTHNSDTYFCLVPYSQKAVQFVDNDNMWHRRLLRKANGKIVRGVGYVGVLPQQKKSPGVSGYRWSQQPDSGF